MIDTSELSPNYQPPKWGVFAYVSDKPKRGMPTELDNIFFQLKDVNSSAINTRIVVHRCRRVRWAQWVFAIGPVVGAIFIVLGIFRSHAFHVFDWKVYAGPIIIFISILKLHAL